MKAISLALCAFLFFGCAQLPDPQRSCSETLSQIPNDIKPGMSRVFILKPQRSFMERFSLLGDNATPLLSTEKYEVLYESTEKKIGDMREARIVYFDVPKGTHALYVKTNTQEDMTYVSRSKMVFDASDTIYFLLRDLPDLSTSITGRGYLQGYMQVTQNQFIEALKESCDRLNIMKVSKLATE